MVFANQIISRREWGADTFRGTPKPMSVDTIVVHHAAGFKDDGTRADALSRTRQIQSVHQGSNRWSDIGYHYIVSRGGYVLRGRPEVNGNPVVGAHSPPNTGKIGVCLLGCFHPPAGGCNDQLQDAQRTALVDLLHYLCKRHDVALGEIKPHSDFNATACPGDNVRGQLEEIRREAAQAPRADAVIEEELQKIEASVARIRSVSP